MVWVHWALSELLAAAARAWEPEWVGLPATLSSGEQLHGESAPDSKPGLASRLPEPGVGVGGGGVAVGVGVGAGVRLGVGVGVGAGVPVGVGVGVRVGVGVGVGVGPEPCRPFTTAVSNVVDGSSSISEKMNAPAKP